MGGGRPGFKHARLWVRGVEGCVTVILSRIFMIDVDVRDVREKPELLVSLTCAPETNVPAPQACSCSPVG